MFKKLKRWYDSREHARGFDYATEALRRGTASVDELSAWVQMSRDFHSFTSFDKGVMEAIWWHKEVG